MIIIYRFLEVRMMPRKAPSRQALARGTAEEMKVFNDPVHGHMEFHPLCVAIMDTPEFQRLRFLKQLGGCYFVYPGASHNRFEHSLGVCFLAGQLVRRLRERQPELGISDEDVLCVQIAGLCHDLGHGPFSHVFDKTYMPKAKPGTKWKHEQASLHMFDYMVENNSNVKTCFDDCNLTNGHKQFIKQLIEGKPPTKVGETETPPSEGKWFYSSEEKKVFLYEIVANKRNGVDVDKWDYFKRDSLHLGMSSGFDHTRLIKFARVIEVKKGQWQICFRDKEAFNMYEMFHTRQVLHRRAYQHKTVQKIELMLVDAMLNYDKYLGKKRPMHKYIDDMKDYVKLTDAMFHDILQKDGGDSDLKKAQNILQNIHKRKLYELVGESEPYTDDPAHKGAKKKPRIATVVEMEIVDFSNNELDDQCFAVQFLTLDFGMKEKNPMENVRFYSKTNMQKTFPLKASEVSSMLPQKIFEERQVRLFFRPSEDKGKDTRRIQLLKKAFNKWCKAKKLKPRRLPRKPQKASA